jgi:hypothetical protein
VEGPVEIRRAVDQHQRRAIGHCDDPGGFSAVGGVSPVGSRDGGGSIGVSVAGAGDFDGGAPLVQAPDFAGGAALAGTPDFVVGAGLVLAPELSGGAVPV